MKTLGNTDPEIAGLIAKEAARQAESLELIASENIVSAAVLEAMGSILTNKYSEGYPGKRYYAGNEVIDEIENLARTRACALFGAEHANVQPHSGSQANQAVYAALLAPGDKVLAMDLAHGGHLTHGASVNFSGKLYSFVHYGVSRETGLVDMEAVREIALREKPKLIVAGYSAYSRVLDFKAFREIADACGALLMVDMAHFAGLVAAGVYPSPVPFAQVVVTTTHKTLRGPRGAIILCKKEFAKAIDSAVFPGAQGGPLENVVAAKAVALLEASTPQFKVYGAQVVRNAQVLAEVLRAGGLKIVSGGTDNHLMLIDIAGSSLGANISMSGGEAETLLHVVGLSTNKNMIPFDTRKPMDPSGLRIGTPSVTTRGMKEAQMQELGEIILETLKGGAATAKARVSALARQFPV